MVLVGGQMLALMPEYILRLLMDNSMTALVEDAEDGVDPAKILEKAHADTNVIGSSTACIIALTNQEIHAINVGDSGFMVIMDGSIVFRSPVQQHGFNFPHQLASGDSGCDLPSSGQVAQDQRKVLGPQVTTQNIANLGQQIAHDKKKKTPFATAAHDAGFRYFGGKLDDITVVVSYITGEEIM